MEHHSDLSIAIGGFFRLNGNGGILLCLFSSKTFFEPGTDRHHRNKQEFPYRSEELQNNGEQAGLCQYFSCHQSADRPGGNLVHVGSKSE